LEYGPGRYGDAAELAYLCAALGTRPYVTHMRGYGVRAGVGMAEATEIVREARVPLHVSHYHGPAADLLRLLDGVEDVTFDSYPYQRASSILGMVALPDWLPTADLAATIAALGDAAVQERLRAGWSGDLWPRLTLACVTHPD